MSDWTFPASIQIATDWVNRNLLYPTDRDLRPIPRHVNFVWFTTIKAGPIKVTDKFNFLRPGVESVQRDVRFFLGDVPVASITLDGLRHHYHLTGRRAHTEWMPASVRYLLSWPSLVGAMHKEELEPGNWTNLSPIVAPEG